jgi:hypothetical protein
MINPNVVTSPKGRVENLKVIYNSGEKTGAEHSWSLAEMKWDGTPAMGLRWNGPGIGTPHSRGIPTWFIVPEEVANIVVEMLKLSNKIKS